ncbi:MAG: VWA domain-containing protein [Bdellovibrionales bacterium]|nr:VWA domain-containing protein [Bdellovibrionales bacterium]
MTWKSMIAFVLLIPLLMVIVWLRINKKKLIPTLQFSHISSLKNVAKTWRSRLSFLPTALKVVAIVLAIVALARPQKMSTKIKKNVEGIDIVIALDVSDSMLIEDMKPENRLEASKKTIKEFVEKRISDRVGLVVFSGESYTRVPLTLDYPLFQKSLREVETTRNIKMGTAIGVALANAVGRLKDSTAKSRVVIFLTDGENNSGTIDPDTALEIAKGYGVKVYSIGMGKDGQAQLPIFITGPGGKQIKRYRPMHSKVNEELLSRMASQTGGKYYRATTSNALEAVFADINELEKTKIEVNKFTRYDELFMVFLRWALLFYILSGLFGRSVLRRSP